MNEQLQNEWHLGLRCYEVQTCSSETEEDRAMRWPMHGLAGQHRPVQISPSFVHSGAQEVSDIVFQVNSSITLSF